MYRGERLSRDAPTPEDRKRHGFPAHWVAASQTPEDMIRHIIEGTLDSPFISVSRSRMVASQYATDQGVVYELELDSSVVLIDPVKAIRAWMIENGIWSGEGYSRATEAIQLAEKDEELLVAVHIPAEAIISSDLTHGFNS